MRSVLTNFSGGLAVKIVDHRHDKRGGGLIQDMWLTMGFNLANWIKGDKLVEVQGEKHVKFSEAKNVEMIYESQRAGSCVAQKILSMTVRNNKRCYDATILSAASLGDEQAMERAICKSRNINCVNVVNSRGWTPLMYASQKGNHRACSMLLRCGAKIDAQNDKGRTALMLSASWGHSKTAEIIIQYLCSLSPPIDAATQIFHYVNMRDNEGRTALHHAVLVNHTQCVTVLLKSNADPEVVDKENRSPLSIAKQFSESGRSSAYKELLKYRRH